MNKVRNFNNVWRFTCAALALAFAAIVASPSTSHAAGTAAGTNITNIVTVNYNNSANVPQLAQTASAVVTVTLVASAVNIIPDITTNTVFEGAATLVAYTVFGTANGKDSYTFSRSETAGANISTVNGTVNPFAPATLAGTSLAVATVGGEAVITVPLDSSVGYATTGLQVGTVLRIGTNTYTVSVITPNVGANTMDLTLNGATLAAGTVLPVGTIIGEQKTFTVSFPSGALSGANSSTQTANATVASATTPAQTSTSANTVITVNINPASLAITKSVCTATPAVGAPTCFAATGNAAPAGTVLYKVVVVNSGTGVAKAVQISDIIQKYLAYNTGSAKFKVGATGPGSPSTLNYNDATMTTLTDASAVDDGYTYTVGTTAILYAYPPDLANGNELVLFYSATVN